MKKEKEKPKLIVILGPTASGKSDLAIQLALFLQKKSINSEIISADSRQVYRQMNIGTGKITKKEMKNIPHHLLDVVSPKTRFTVAHYQRMGLKKIKEILNKNNLPIIVGGTGFYIQALTEGIIIPNIKPNWPLRKKLEKKSTTQLYQILKKLDPTRAKTIEKNNPRRLIRALEIIFTTKKPVAPIQKNPLPYQILILGVKKSKGELKELIKKRLIKRLNNGMIKEVRKLRKNGLSWKRLEEFGLEYRWLAHFLQNKISHQEMIEKLQHAIEQFARRQMVWFSAHGGSPVGGKRDERIKWVKNYNQAKKIVNSFLKP
jgi:tRNA dimethylallyltransferase